MHYNIQTVSLFICHSLSLSLFFSLSRFFAPITCQVEKGRSWYLDFHANTKWALSDFLFPLLPFLSPLSTQLTCLSLSLSLSLSLTHSLLFLSLSHTYSLSVSCLNRVHWFTSHNLNRACILTGSHLMKPDSKTDSLITVVYVEGTFTETQRAMQSIETASEKEWERERERERGRERERERVRNDRWDTFHSWPQFVSSFRIRQRWLFLSQWLTLLLLYNCYGCYCCFYCFCWCYEVYNMRQEREERKRKWRGKIVSFLLDCYCYNSRERERERERIRCKE